MTLERYHGLSAQDGCIRSRERGFLCLTVESVGHVSSYMSRSVKHTRMVVQEWESGCPWGLGKERVSVGTGTTLLRIDLVER